jgi:hypothetical protein
MVICRSTGSDSRRSTSTHSTANKDKSNSANNSTTPSYDRQQQQAEHQYTDASQDLSITVDDIHLHNEVSACLTYYKCATAFCANFECFVSSVVLRATFLCICSFAPVRYYSSRLTTVSQSSVHIAVAGCSKGNMLHTVQEVLLILILTMAIAIAIMTVQYHHDKSPTEDITLVAIIHHLV